MPARASHPTRPPNNLTPPRAGQPLLGPRMPEITDINELMARDLSEPDELVSGLIHRGTKIMLAGGSKTFKTWSFLDLAISVACGVPWWDFPTTQGRVLYVNFEIQDVFFRKRYANICEAKGVQTPAGRLDYLGLRGFAGDASKIVQVLLQRIGQRGYDLIVIDPIYKCYGERDENSASGMADLLNQFEKLAVESGAAVVYGHHHSKGDQAGKESIDRASGSGTFARDADTIIDMVRHKEAGAFIVECTLRNFPPQEKFVVRRVHPLMIRDASLDSGTPRAVTRTSNNSRYGDEELIALLDPGALPFGVWLEQASERFGISRSQFANKRREFMERGLIVQSDAAGLYSRAPIQCVSTENPSGGVRSSFVRQSQPSRMARVPLEGEGQGESTP